MRILLAALALTVPPPTMAQTGINGQVGGAGASVHDNNGRIDRERAAGRLSRSDARRAKTENGITDDLARRYGGDGRLTDAEQAEITNRNNAMQSILNAPARTGPKR
ncbi:hypothetical protein [Sphingomonas phyllosphaerae]|uniref:hypothetical protein n=1 Tax=Sphingomonas phyllosphaerae TaxID=257003 RepID=UPI00048AB0F3|nr:hypothetical protein [Sphingomonas phyllosphaerae]